MPVRFGDLYHRTRKVQVEYQGDVVNVEYRVNAITPAFVAANLDPVSQIKEVVVTWDVLDDSGNPILPEKIADKLPLEFLGMVMEAIVHDMQVGNTEKKE